MYLAEWPNDLKFAPRAAGRTSSRCRGQVRGLGIALVLGLLAYCGPNGRLLAAENWEGIAPVVVDLDESPVGEVTTKSAGEPLLAPVVTREQASRASRKPRRAQEERQVPAEIVTVPVADRPLAKRTPAPIVDARPNDSKNRRGQSRHGASLSRVVNQPPKIDSEFKRPTSISATNLAPIVHRNSDFRYGTTDSAAPVTIDVTEKTGPDRAPAVATDPVAVEMDENPDSRRETIEFRSVNDGRDAVPRSRVGLLPSSPPRALAIGSLNLTREPNSGVETAAAPPRTGQFHTHRSGRLIRANTRLDAAELTWQFDEQPVITDEAGSEELGWVESTASAAHENPILEAIPVAADTTTTSASTSEPELLENSAATSAVRLEGSAELIQPSLQMVQSLASSVSQPAESQSAKPLPPQPPNEALPGEQLDSEAEEDLAADTGEVFRPIQELGVNIAPPAGVLPENRAAAKFAKEGEQLHVMGFSRPEPETHFEWSAPALCHRPLFFEDVNLERHGYHVRYAQPLISAAHFFGRVPAIPYLYVSQRARECRYTLGHYRPGSHAPYVWYYPQPSLTGTALEGAVAVGLILAIP